MSWGYDGATGPANWDQFKGAGVTGSKQSPINIDGADGSAGALKVSYGAGPVELENIGWTFKAKTGSGSISGGCLGGTYKLDSFHAHWGKKGENGSEHQLKGQSHTAELHIVHFNEKYGDFASAASKPDGLAIIAVFMQAGGDNPALSGVCGGMGGIASKGGKGAAGNIDVGALLGGGSTFYCYEGSLTTPPLTESVHWLVSDKVVTVGEGQLDAFRSMNDGSGKPLVHNHRPVVAKGSRKITTCTL